MEHANPIQIQKYLKGIDYPASKADLIENARKLGADESVCASLEQLPDEHFQTPAEVSQAFKGPSEDHAERARPERDGGGSAGRGKWEQDSAKLGDGNAFLAQAMEEASAEIEMCMMALKKSSNAQVRDFAQTMIDEHGKLGQKVERLAERKHLDLPTELGKEHASLIDDLSALTADQFDRRFIAQNLKEHEKELKIFKHYALDESDRDIKALAEEGEAMLARHLKMVKELDKRMSA
jgi:predicted outer membrane protein